VAGYDGYAKTALTQKRARAPTKPTIPWRRSMPKYQIIEGDYSYQVEADNYADALDYVKDYEKEGE